MRPLANDRIKVVHKAGKGSCVVTWDRNDYIAEAEQQLTLKINFSTLIFNLKRSQI